MKELLCTLTLAVVIHIYTGDGVSQNHTHIHMHTCKTCNLGKMGELAHCQLPGCAIVLKLCVMLALGNSG